MPTTEAGHQPNRMYRDQDGNIHLNGAKLYKDEVGSYESGSIEITANGVGAVNGTGVSASERKPVVHQTVLTLSDVSIALADSSAGGGLKIYDMPEGRIQFLGATASIIFTTVTSDTTTINASKTANWGLGSTVQANGTLATTEQNIIPTTNYTTAAQNVASTVSKAALAATFQLDGTTTPVDIYLNIGLATGTDIDGDGTVTANGSITITWTNLGDY